jgi:hypothetical protein
MKIKIKETGKVVNKSDFVARLFVRKGLATFHTEKEDKTPVVTKEEQLPTVTKEVKEVRVPQRKKKS